MTVMSSLSRLLAAGLVAAVPALAPALAPAEPLPAPRTDIPATPGARSATAVLAGGCFWGVDAVFKHVKGVEKVVSGYAGGSKATAHYEIVGSGATGHAESVQVTYDPSKVSYGELLRIFFSVAHDPTQLNRQGPDRGTQYRSAIFYVNDTQKQVAEAYVRQLGEAGAFKAPIVTQIAPLPAFFPAEDYHQDYLARHPTQPYIVYNDLPKLAALKSEFPDRYRAP
jgi:peptide-methionine (S)-S-oxide reductase